MRPAGQDCRMGTEATQSVARMGHQGGPPTSFCCEALAPPKKSLGLENSNSLGHVPCASWGSNLLCRNEPCPACAVHPACSLSASLPYPLCSRWSMCHGARTLGLLRHCARHAPASALLTKPPPATCDVVSGHPISHVDQHPEL